MKLRNNKPGASVWIWHFEIFQFKFCFLTAFTNEFRSFVDCSVLVSFGDCKFFFQTQMAFRDGMGSLGERYSMYNGQISLVYGSPVFLGKNLLKVKIAVVIS